MAKSTRKFAALFLSLALLFSLSMPAFAAETHDHDCGAVACEDYTIGESASPLSICTSHTLEITSTLIPYGGYYISASSCQASWIKTEKCTKCGHERVIERYGVQGAHYSVVYSVSCNGTTQTWQNRCYYCGHSTPTTTKRCPGAPHGGACGYLPV